MSRTAQAFLYLIYFAILAVLGGFILHSFSNDSTTTSKPTKPAITQKAAPKQTAKTPSTNQSKPSTPAPTATSSNSSNNLVNTGPGDVVIVFAASAALGTAAYQYKLRTNYIRR